jgi:16S rRNA (uracil1498-N3)-methyltransferase
MRILLLSDPDRPGRLQPGQSVVLDEEESHHLLHVLRGTAEAEFRLTDGHGNFYDGRLQSRRGGLAKILILNCTPDPIAEERPRLSLACAVAKGKRFEWALEKSVELGVHQIWPLQTDRTVVRPRRGKIERWRHILRTALKQSGRSVLPELMPVGGLASCLAALTGGRLFYGVAPEGAPDSEPEGRRVPRPSGPGRPSGMVELLRGTGTAGPPPERLIWFVGPEGGWTDREAERLAATGAEPVHLGPHPLRTETAAVAGLVLLQALRRHWLDAADRTP